MSQPRKPPPSDDRDDDAADLPEDPLPPEPEPESEREPESESAPEPTGPAAPAVAQAAPPPRESRDRIEEAMTRFLSSRRDDEGVAFIRGKVIDKLYTTRIQRENMDDALVDDLTQQASLQAAELKSPPWTERGIRGWVTRLTNRTVFRYYRHYTRDKKYIDHDVDAAELGGGHAFPETDFGARRHLITKHMRKLVADDPVKLKILDLIDMHYEGYSIEELARDNGMTPGALSLRIHRLRKELGPKVSVMDDEKKRRMILIACWGGGPLLVVVVALWLLLQPAPPPTPAPVVHPAPTASAPHDPTLDIAHDTAHDIPAPRVADASVQVADAGPRAQPPPQPRPRPRPQPTSADGGAANGNGLEDDSKGPPR